MQKQSNIRILEILKYLYLRTDEEHPVTVADILDYLNGKGIHAVRQTVYAKQINISQKAVNKRRHKILSKLRALMKIK